MLQVLISLAFVLGLLMLCLYLVKKYKGFHLLNNKAHTLRMEEVLFIDPKTKVALISKGDVKYVVLLGKSEILLDKYTDI